MIAAILLAACTWRDPGPPDTRPNVLLLSLDTLRADHLDFYGYDRETAPFLAELARESVVFDHAYSQSSATTPTHGSLFTSKFVSQHGYFSVKFKLSDVQETMAERFKAKGYRTFAVTSSIRFIPETGFDQGFDDYERLEGRKIERSATVTEHALERIGERPTQPFFGFVHYFDAHAPYKAPKELRQKWTSTSETTVKPSKISQFIATHQKKPGAVPEETIAYLQALYDAEILYMDGFVRQLIEGLPEDRSTLVIVTADHGEGFAEHGHLGHSDFVHEELIKVPLLWWWPGHLEGRRVAMPVQSVDVLPTMLELLGEPVPEGLSGQSLAHVIRSGDDTRPSPDGDLLLVQAPRRWGVLKTFDTGRFKLTVDFTNDQATALYDLGEDPTGTRDVSAEHPLEAKALHEILASMDLEDSKGQAVERTDVTPEEIKELEALGYVE